MGVGVPVAMELLSVPVAENAFMAFMTMIGLTIIAGTAVQRWGIMKMRLIDGDAIYAEIDKLRDVKNMNGFELIQLDCTLAVIKYAKTIDPLKHGKWTYDTDTEDTPLLVCSVCDDWVYDTNYEYCPHCGAKMDMREE